MPPSVLLFLGQEYLNGLCSTVLGSQPSSRLLDGQSSKKTATFAHTLPSRRLWRRDSASGGVLTKKLLGLLISEFGHPIFKSCLRLCGLGDCVPSCLWEEPSCFPCLLRVKYGGGYFLTFHFNGKMKCLQGLKDFISSLVTFSLFCHFPLFWNIYPHFASLGHIYPLWPYYFY